MIQYEHAIDEILAEIKQTLAQIKLESIEMVIEDLAKAERIFIAGSGRSGLVMRCFGIRLMHVGKQVFVVGETNTPRISKDDLLVIGSGSGRTDSLVVYAGKARLAGARLMLFTINSDSPIAKLATLIVEISASSHKVPLTTSTYISVQPKGSLFEQSLLLLADYFIVEMMKRAGLTSDDLFARHANLE